MYLFRRAGGIANANLAISNMWRNGGGGDSASISKPRDGEEQEIYGTTNDILAPLCRFCYPEGLK